MHKHLIVPSLLLLFLNAGPAHAREQVTEATQVRGTPITLVRSVVRSLPITATVTGEIESKADPTVAAEVEGRTLSIQVDEGEKVEAGQLLALLDAEAHEIALEQAEADSQRLLALIQNHRRTVKRFRGLLKKQSTAQSELDRAETELAAALAELNSARARIKDARYQLARAKITSPISGVVQQRRVAVGDYVRKGDPLFQIVATDQLRARLYFAETQAPRVRPGLPLKLRIADRPQTIDAAISRVRPMLNPENRALEALADFDNPGGWLPGYSVTAEVKLATLEEAVMVPVLSLARRPGGTVVYRIENGRALQQPVALGARDGEWVQITAGLEAGVTLALDGAGFLTDGASVEARSETP